MPALRALPSESWPVVTLARAPLGVNSMGRFKREKNFCDSRKLDRQTCQSNNGLDEFFSKQLQRVLNIDI